MKANSTGIGSTASGNPDRRSWPGSAVGWVTEAPPAAARGRMTRAALAFVGVVLLLSTFLVATAALMIGSRPLDRPGDGGLLVYQLGSDVYLAQADGTNPRQLTTRAGDRPIGP